MLTGLVPAFAGGIATDANAGSAETAGALWVAAGAVVGVEGSVASGCSVFVVGVTPVAAGGCAGVASLVAGGVVSLLPPPVADCNILLPASSPPSTVSDSSTTLSSSPLSSAVSDSPYPEASCSVVAVSPSAVAVSASIVPFSPS